VNKVSEMSVQSNAPIIIKRKKVIAGGGHHGGAWKVAYADFVTAMMAFFMLMWLLNATTEQQRKGLADYFAPTVPLNRVSGGGDGMFGGQDIFSQALLPETGTGGVMKLDGMAEHEAVEVAQLRELEEVLVGRGGEALLSEDARRHVVTRVTDEGLVIELFDLDDTPLFQRDGTEPRQVTLEILAVIARVSGLVKNGLSIDGHIATPPIVATGPDGWELSSGRADSVRQALMEFGVDPDRFLRLSGHADQDPAVPLETSIRNNRIEVIFLRSENR
jgi:chemotaxis protein MotB